MGDAESLLLVLVVIYILECLVWIRRGQVLVAQTVSRTFRPRHAGLLPGNHHGSVFLSWPLPPLGTAVLPLALPFSVSPEGLLAYTALCPVPGNRPPQSGRFHAWNEVSAVAARGRWIVVNDAPFVRLNTGASARRWAERLSKLRKTAAAAREELLRGWIHGMFDAQAARGRFEAVRQHLPRLRVPANILFLYTYLLAPWLVFQFGMRHVGWPLLAGLLAQTVLLALRFRRSHLALHPEEPEDRFKHTLTMLLSPPSAIRAHDILARHSLEGFHPLTAVRVLCPDGWFRDLARRVALDLHHPLHPVCPLREPDAVSTERWFRTRLTEAAESYLKAHGCDPTALRQPAPPQEAAIQSYCPRCGEQFLLLQGQCPDCGGLPLAAYPKLEREARVG